MPEPELEIKKPEIEKPKEVAEKPPEVRIETEEDIKEIGDKTAQDIEQKSEDVITSENETLESAIKNIGADPELVEQVKTATGLMPEFLKNQEEILKHKENAVGAIKEVLGEKPVELKDTYSKENLAELRKKTAEKYGEGLVFKCHEKGMTLEEHEEAQRKAYEALDEKIEKGVVKPDSIQSDILENLELRKAPEVTVEKVEDIAGHTSKELKEFTEKGMIKEDEAKLIQEESEKFTKLYQEAYPDATPQEIFELVRDNERKLAYQTMLDKKVFSGSDHGTKHILEGNMKYADKLIESLGDRVLAKDKVLIHQVIIDHDLGYTTGIAQAKESFAASKDHPLFSTKLIEANKGYYAQKFGEAGFNTIREGILQHSYVKSEYNSPRDEKTGINMDIVRSITSTVDALGVTAEVKCPAFFRNPEAIKTQIKVRLYADTHEGKVDPDYLEKCKNELRETANKEPDAKRREGYLNAIDNQFNPKTVEKTLGQYVGVLEDIKIQERADGKIIPHIKMGISQEQALIGALYGDKECIAAFDKAMGDFGVDKTKYAHMAETIRAVQAYKDEDEKEKQRLTKELTYESDKGVFEFSPEFLKKAPEIGDVFKEFKDLSLRDEITEATSKLEKEGGRTPENVVDALGKLTVDVSKSIDKEDMTKIIEIQNKIRHNIDNEEEFKKATTELKSFLSKKEKEFLGIK